MDFSAVNVLYLEDEPFIALDTADALESFGFRDVVAVHSLASAERYASATHFDVAVLDINLGGGQTSLALGRSLKAKGTYVLFASGNSRNLDELVADGYGYLMKPFGVAELRNSIEKTICQPVAKRQTVR